MQIPSWSWKSEPALASILKCYLHVFCGLMAVSPSGVYCKCISFAGYLGLGDRSSDIQKKLGKEWLLFKIENCFASLWSYSRHTQHTKRKNGINI